MIYINKKNYIYLIGLSVLIVAFTLILIPKEENSLSTNKLNATVINTTANKLTVQDENNIIYTFNLEENNYKAGDSLIIEYTGLLDKNTQNQNNNLINITPVSQDEDFIITNTSEGIFSKFSLLATDKLNEMTLEEKIGQILLVRYPDTNIDQALNKYMVGGFVFFEKDFKDKTTQDVQNMMKSLQQKSKIPLLTAVDEEGGSVVRISSNKKLIDEPFLSPRDLYKEGGFDLIRKDTIRKNELLEKLGLNVNLAPVVDVSTDPNDYMYNRTIGEDTKLTSTYAKTVIEASKDSKVSYVLKHFPGYGNNADTHTDKVVDTRSFSDIETNDLPPFEAGIASNAEAILVSHNTVQSIDENNPASLSPSVHNLLRNNLGFTGVIITDDLAMGATSSIENATVKALIAGNDIIMTTDYEKSFNDIIQALDDNVINETLIDSVVHRILSWKYYKGIMYENQK